jgi:hypothetical protein
MNKTVWLICGILFVTLAAKAGPGSVDEQDIRALQESFTVAWDRADAKALAAFFTDARPEDAPGLLDHRRQRSCGLRRTEGAWKGSKSSSLQGSPRQSAMAAPILAAQCDLLRRKFLQSLAGRQARRFCPHAPRRRRDLGPEARPAPGPAPTLRKFPALEADFAAKRPRTGPHHRAPLPVPARRRSVSASPTIE